MQPLKIAINMKWKSIQTEYGNLFELSMQEGEDERKLPKTSIDLFKSSAEIERFAINSWERRL